MTSEEQKCAGKWDVDGKRARLYLWLFTLRCIIVSCRRAAWLWGGVPTPPLTPIGFAPTHRISVSLHFHAVQQSDSRNNAKKKKDPKIASVSVITYWIQRPHAGRSLVGLATLSLDLVPLIGEAQCSISSFYRAGVYLAGRVEVGSAWLGAGHRTKRASQSCAGCPKKSWRRRQKGWLIHLTWSRINQLYYISHKHKYWFSELYLPVMQIWFS